MNTADQTSISVRTTVPVPYSGVTRSGSDEIHRQIVNLPRYRIHELLAANPIRSAMLFAMSLTTLFGVGYYKDPRLQQDLASSMRDDIKSEFGYNDDDPGSAASLDRATTIGSSAIGVSLIIGLSATSFLAAYRLIRRQPADQMRYRKAEALLPFLGNQTVIGDDIVRQLEFFFKNLNAEVAREFLEKFQDQINYLRNSSAVGSERYTSMWRLIANVYQHIIRPSQSTGVSQTIAVAQPSAAGAASGTTLIAIELAPLSSLTAPQPLEILDPSLMAGTALTSTAARIPLTGEKAATEELTAAPASAMHGGSGGAASVPLQALGVRARVAAVRTSEVAAETLAIEAVVEGYDNSPWYRFMLGTVLKSDAWAHKQFTIENLISLLKEISQGEDLNYQFANYLESLVRPNTQNAISTVNYAFNAFCTGRTFDKDDLAIAYASLINFAHRPHPWEGADNVALMGYIKELNQKLLEQQTLLQAAKQSSRILDAKLNAATQHLRSHLERLEINFNQIVSDREQLVAQFNEEMLRIEQNMALLPEQFKLLVAKLNQLFTQQYNSLQQAITQLEENQRLLLLALRMMPSSNSAHATLETPADYKFWPYYLAEFARNQFDPVEGEKKVGPSERAAAFNCLWQDSFFDRNASADDKRLVILGFLFHWVDLANVTVIDTANDKQLCNSSSTDNRRARFAKERQADIASLRAMGLEKFAMIIHILVGGIEFHKRLALEILKHPSFPPLHKAELLALLVKNDTSEDLLKPVLYGLLPENTLAQPKSLAQLLAAMRKDFRPYLLRILVTTTTKELKDLQLAQRAVWSEHFTELMRQTLFKTLIASTRPSMPHAEKALLLLEKLLWPINGEAWELKRAPYVLKYLLNELKPHAPELPEPDYFLNFVKILLQEFASQNLNRWRAAHQMLSSIIFGLNAPRNKERLLAGLLSSNVEGVVPAARVLGVSSWASAVASVFVSLSLENERAKALGLFTHLFKQCGETRYKLALGYPQSSPAKLLQTLREASVSNFDSSSLVWNVLISYLLVQNATRENLSPEARSCLKQLIECISRISFSELPKCETLLSYFEFQKVWDFVLVQMIIDDPVSKRKIYSDTFYALIAALLHAQYRQNYIHQRGGEIQKRDCARLMRHYLFSAGLIASENSNREQVLRAFNGRFLDILARCSLQDEVNQLQQVAAYGLAPIQNETTAIRSSGTSRSYGTSGDTASREAAADAINGMINPMWKGRDVRRSLAVKLPSAEPTAPQAAAYGSVGVTATKESAEATNEVANPLWRAARRRSLVAKVPSAEPPAPHAAASAIVKKRENSGEHRVALNPLVVRSRAGSQAAHIPLLQSSDETATETLVLVSSTEDEIGVRGLRRKAASPAHSVSSTSFSFQPHAAVQAWTQPAEALRVDEVELQLDERGAPAAPATAPATARRELATSVVTLNVLAQAQAAAAEMLLPGTADVKASNEEAAPSSAQSPALLVTQTALASPPPAVAAVSSATQASGGKTSFASRLAQLRSASVETVAAEGAIINAAAGVGRPSPAVQPPKLPKPTLAPHLRGTATQWAFRSQLPAAASTAMVGAAPPHAPAQSAVAARRHHRINALPQSPALPHVPDKKPSSPRP